MYEFEDPKQMVLEIIWDGKHINRFVCELRLTLFINALKVVAIRPQCLMPFPHHFYDPKTKINDIDGLNQHIKSLPPLDDLKEETELPILTWKLLHWIFTNPLNIKPFPTYEEEGTVNERLQRLRTETKLTDIPRFTKSLLSHFEIITTCPNAAFLEGKAKFGTFFAYHGSKLENFHSIIHRGLKSTLNQRSSYGHGTYLTLQFQTARRFASKSNLWEHSRLITNAKESRVRCIAIVEVVDDPSINWPQVENNAEQSTEELWSQRRKSICCVVDSDHLMQLRYLIVLFH